MYYGDEQANYTGMRASYGPFGGMMAAGAQAQMGYGGGGGGGYGPDASPLQQIGGMIRPLGYMPPAKVYVSATGQYTQPGGIGRSFGAMIGYNDPPRNISSYDYRMYGASDFADRVGVGTFAGVSTGVGLAAGMAVAPMGAAAGGLVGAGVGGIAGSLFGPLGTLAGAKVGAAVGGFVGGIGASFVPSIATAGMSDVLNQQMQVRSHLENSSFRFATSSSNMADPRFASGMSSQARGAIAEHLTSMDVKDPFMDTEDLTKVLKGATSMGLMNNTQTTEEFKKKFKDITDNVKTVARVLNTTLEDGLKTMKDFRGIGITDANEVGRLTLQSQAQGKMAGKTAGEMVEVGMQGAEMMRGTGISMSIGFKASQMNLTAVRAARDANVLSQEAVAQAGGEEALAQRMTASGVGFVQSAQGRGMMASFYGAEGGLDTAAMYKGMSGSMTVPEMAMAAAKNLSSPKKLLEFQANQAKLVSEAGKAFGGQGLEMMRLGGAMSNARFLSETTGVSVETGLRNTLLQQGMSESEVDMSVARIQNADKEYASRQKAINATRTQELAESGYQNFFMTRLASKAGDVIKGAYSAVTNPVGRGIDTMREGYRDFTEGQMQGLRRYDVSDIGNQVNAGNEAARSLAMGKSPRVVDIFAGSNPVNLDNAAFSATTGSALKDRLESISANFGINPVHASSVREYDSTGKLKANDPEVILRDSTLGGRTGTSKADLKMFSTALATLGGISDDETTAYKKDSTTYAGTLRSMQKKAAGKDLSSFKNYGDMLKYMTGKDITSVSREEAMAVRDVTQGTKAGELFDELNKDYVASTNVVRGLGVEMVKSEEGKYRKTKGDFEKYLGTEKPISDEAYQLIIKAQSEKDPKKKEELMLDAGGMISKTTGMGLNSFYSKIDSLGGTELGKTIAGANEGLNAVLSAKGMFENRDQFLSKAKSAGYFDSKKYGAIAEAALGGGKAFSTEVIKNKDMLEKQGMTNVVLQAEALESVDVASGAYEAAIKSGDKGSIKSTGARLSSLLSSKDKITGFGLNEEGANQHMKAIAEGRRADSIDTLYNQQKLDLSGTSDISGATRSAGTQTSAAGSGQEAFATQININQAILANLQAMQQLLNGVKK